MNVNVVANPLKTFKVVHSLKRTEDNKEQHKFEYTVDLYPNYFDLNVGIWNVAISQAIFSNNQRNNTISSLFNVTTSLLSHAVPDPYYKPIEKTDLPFSRIASRNVVLTTVGVYKLKYQEMQIERYNPPLFFQIENSNRATFSVCYSEINENQKVMNLDIELTFLFQRLL